MAQSNVPVKQPGDSVSHAEINSMNTAINSKADAVPHAANIDVASMMDLRLGSSVYLEDEDAIYIKLCSGLFPLALSAK